MFTVNIATQKITNEKTFSIEDKNKKLTFDFLLFGGGNDYFAQGESFALSIGNEDFSVFAIDDNKLSFRNVQLNITSSQNRTVKITNTKTNAEILSDTVSFTYTGETGGGGASVDVSSFVTSETVSAMTSAIETELQGVNSAVLANAGAVSSIQGDITSLTSNVAANAASVGVIESNVSVISADVQTIESNVSANAVNIQTLESNVSSITVSVSAIQADVLTAGSAVSTNAVNIQTLESAVSANAGNIQAANSAVSANAGAVSSIRGDITSLTSNVSAITATIGNIGSALDIINGESI